MREALDRSGMRYRVKEGDGAFYAPKIDIQIEDALGREWQTATVQADLVMLPERFDLTYVEESGEHVRPVAIHRAIYGSLERFIGVLIEHTGGALPFWCAPVQAVVIPIADRHAEAALELAVVLRAKGIRVEVDESSNRMQNKIRLAQEQKVPYMLVLGDREIEARTASPRTRAGEQQEPVGWDGPGRPARGGGGGSARILRLAQRSGLLPSANDALVGGTAMDRSKASRQGRGPSSRWPSLSWCLLPAAGAVAMTVSMALSAAAQAAEPTPDAAAALSAAGLSGDRLTEPVERPGHPRGGRGRLRR